MGLAISRQLNGYEAVSQLELGHLALSDLETRSDVQSGAAPASGGGTTTLPALLPAAILAAAAQAEHLRLSAGFLRWLPEKQPAALSSPQHAQSMVHLSG